MPARTFTCLSRLAPAAALLLAAVTPARATVFTETEPNDSKATPNVVNGFTSGDQFTGSSTGASLTTPGPTSADYFRLNFPAPAAPGIYRQQITLTTGFTGSIRGLTQTAGTINAGTDASPQGTTTVGGNPTNQLYTFGDATSVFYRVTGTTATTTPYFATLTTTPVTPTVVAGAFQAGSLTISSVGQTTADTDLWIYDAGFHAIPGYGNDEAFGTTVSQSTLTANFAAGTYYVAISNYNLANDQASPASDRDRTSTVLDAAGVLLSSNTLTNQNNSFTITDASGNPVVVPVTKINAHDVNFIQFTVVPEPSTYALLALGGLGLAVAARPRRARLV